MLLPGSLAIERQQCKIEQWREKEKWIEKVERMQKELRERGFRKEDFSHLELSFFLFSPSRKNFQRRLCIDGGIKKELFCILLLFIKQTNTHTELAVRSV